MAGTGAAGAQPATSTPSSPTTTTPVSASATDSGCTPLHLLLVNGTTDSSPTAPTDQDGGFFSQVAIPALLAANGDNGSKNVIDRSYVNYSASFGGKPGDQSTDTYEQSVQMGITNAAVMLTDLASKCPDTQVFIGGYSQGGQVASALVREIGAGEGPISADRFAGAALFSDPTRPAGAPVFASSSQTALRPHPELRVIRSNRSRFLRYKPRPVEVSLRRRRGRGPLARSRIGLPRSARRVILPAIPLPTPRWRAWWPISPVSPT
ncbi:cutinase family protein (plasmid) [Rhodococcus sp. ZPP]|uniref:cutinase family protein n=1 Tax=Rhodococcus sp. ZPP TaxID=2749906 RepID=UPI001AD85BDA|nr:cutinase family protein [Rhodococcus sp. ZPP]QTJ71248.1 cutinase family protein [Rhodococcus sp. ZPP]